jgi:hypothetical protein
MSAEMRKFSEGAIAEALPHGGVKGNMTCTDPATGESLSIVLFRDQAALDAFKAFSDEKIAAAGDVGAAVVGARRVYSEVIAAL